MPLGIPELLLILVIVLVLFGAKRLPDLGRQLGGGMREFRASVRSRDDDDRDEDAAATPGHRELAAGPEVVAPGATVAAPASEDQDEPRRAAD